jgi:hypothetical protein
LASIDELRQFGDNTGAYDFIDVQSMPVSEVTLKDLDE